MKKLIALTFVAGVLLLVPAQQAGAQCTLSIQNCDTGHITPPGSSFGGTSHLSCSVCLFNGQETGAGYCHDCATHNLSSDQQTAYRHAQGAASRGDVREVLRVSAGTGGFVVYNPARRAVQIATCAGNEVLASLPVVGYEQIQMALALPTSLPGAYRGHAAAEQP